MTSYGPIGIFDSGIGGLTVMRALTERLPRETLCYFADTARMPYGPQPPERIREYAFEITDYLLGQGCKQIVIACNTATAAAITDLRKAFPNVPFVGMEPAVKPAATQTQSGKIGVLATQTTLNSPRYQGLMDRFARHVAVFKDPCIGLVPLIEQGHWEGKPTEDLLRSIVAPWLTAGVDTIVMGCTHYPIVRPLLATICGPNVQLIDPAPAAARQAERLLYQRQLLLPPDGKVPPTHLFEASAEPMRLREMARLLHCFNAVIR